MVAWEKKTLNQEQKECTDLLASPEGRERQPPGGNATLQVRWASRIPKKKFTTEQANQDLQDKT